MLQAQTTVELGQSQIEGSTTGLSDSHSFVSGDALGAGISFDLTITAANSSNPSDPVAVHSNGLGVVGGGSGGSLPLGLDNLDDLDASNDESLTFTLTNISGVPGDYALRIVGLTTAFGSTSEQYELSDGSSGNLTNFAETLAVADQESITITARGPTSGESVFTSFFIDSINVALISTAEPPEELAPGEITIEAAPASHPIVRFGTEVGKNYEVQSKADLADAQWTTLTTVGGTGSTVSHTDTTVNTATDAKQFYQVNAITVANGALADGATLTVNQTWSQEPSGYDRTAAVSVPSGSGPFPVVIMFHGNGGNSSFINSMGNRFDNIIRVAPNGYATSWNVDNENSKAPDVDFARSLIALVKTYSNVDPSNISIYGSSNGSGMVNRLLIELEADTFHKAAGRVSQMITKMYQNGTFRYNSSGTNDYDEVIVPVAGRKIINICGTSDGAVPYNGGSGVGTTFMTAQESIYRYAQAMGETGSMLSDAAGVAGDGSNYPADVVRYAYLDGDVVHYKVIGGDHALNPHSNPANDLIADFILNQ